MNITRIVVVGLFARLPRVAGRLVLAGIAFVGSATSTALPFWLAGEMHQDAVGPLSFMVGGIAASLALLKRLVIPVFAFSAVGASAWLAAYLLESLGVQRNPSEGIVVALAVLGGLLATRLFVTLKEPKR